MKIATKEKPAPFAIQFQEKIPKEDIVEIGGKYNEKTQTWDWPKNPQNPSLNMSFPSAESPPTTCTVPTRISPSVVRTDAGVDD